MASQEKESKNKLSSLSEKLQILSKNFEDAQDRFTRDLEIAEAKAVEGSEKDIEALLQKQRNSFDSKVDEMKVKYKSSFSLKE